MTLLYKFQRLFASNNAPGKQEAEVSQRRRRVKVRSSDLLLRLLASVNSHQILTASFLNANTWVSAEQRAGVTHEATGGLQRQDMRTWTQPLRLPTKAPLIKR